MNAPVATSGVVIVSVSATHNATLLDFSKSHVASLNQDACRNSNAAATLRGRIASKSLSNATSAFRFGGSGNNPGASFPEVAKGEIGAKKRGAKSALPLSRL